MVYLCRYRQKLRDDVQYRRILSILDDYGFLHEVSRGEIYFAPTQPVHFVRQRLAKARGASDDLLLTPVLVNTCEDPEAYKFVAFWLRVSEPLPIYTTEQLIAQFDA